MTVLSRLCSRYVTRSALTKLTHQRHEIQLQAHGPNALTAILSPLDGRPKARPNSAHISDLTIDEVELEVHVTSVRRLLLLKSMAF